VGLAAFAAMSCLSWGLASAAQASSPPVIGNEFVSHITEHDATLEAYIDPNGLKTTYQFRLESGCLPPRACLAITTYPLPSGEIPASAGAPDQVVLDLNSAGVTLSPDTEYRYSVEATNSAGTTEGHGQLFTTAPASVPSVESESVSNVTPTDATIQAQINPEGLETTYEVSVETVACMMMRPQGPGPDGCEGTSQGQIVGTVPAGFSTQTVSVDIAKAWHSLSPGRWYLVYVSATNMDGNSGGITQQFETAAASPPLIEGESLSHLTSTDATLEALINTEGLESTYDFYLQGPVAPCLEAVPPCMIEEPAAVALPAGELLGSFVGQSVSADLNSAGISLYPGHYRYWVTATSAAGDTQGTVQRFAASEDGVQPLNTTTLFGNNSSSGSGSQAPGSSASQPTTSMATTSKPLSVKRSSSKHHRKHHRSKAATHKHHTSRAAGRRHRKS
jgi:hypothetical protein